MTPSPYVAASFWRLLLERLGRQAAQTAVPILAVLISAGGQVDVKTVGIALAGSLAVTLGKALFLAFVDVPPDGPATPLAWRLLDRAVPAFAGVLAGLWPDSGLGLLSFNWTAALAAAGAAAVTAVIAVYATPPALFAHVGAHRVEDTTGSAA